MNTDIIDENRLAQEIVIFSDKSSIQEELTRLNSHISQFLSLIQSGVSPVGKKFDFIIQEMNREVNTIGSKAKVSPESAPIKRLVQEAKDSKMAIDATYGRRTRAVIIMDSGHIILSAVQPETVAGRLDKDVVEE